MARMALVSSRPGSVAWPQSSSRSSSTRGAGFASLEIDALPRIERCQFARQTGGRVTRLGEPMRRQYSPEGDRQELLVGATSPPTRPHAAARDTWRARPAEHALACHSSRPGSVAWPQSSSRSSSTRGAGFASLEIDALPRIERCQFARQTGGRVTRLGEPMRRQYSPEGDRQELLVGATSPPTRPHAAARDTWRARPAEHALACHSARSAPLARIFTHTARPGLMTCRSRWWGQSGHSPPPASAGDARECGHGEYAGSPTLRASDKPVCRSRGRSGSTRRIGLFNVLTRPALQRGPRARHDLPRRIDPRWIAGKPAFRARCRAVWRCPERSNRSHAENWERVDTLPCRLAKAIHSARRPVKPNRSSALSRP